jgi:hypothetical protein
MEEAEDGIGFLDILFNMAIVFVALFALAWMLISPPAKTGDVVNKAEFLVTVTWPDGRKEDVDTYVEDPAGNLVWFRTRAAGLMHLDRDDLGERGDVLTIDGREVKNSLNQEIVAIRGFMPGEYTVGVHLYRGFGEIVPVAVKVEKINPVVQTIFYGSVLLPEQGSEKTVVRFTVTGGDSVIDVNTVSKPLVPLRRNTTGGGDR